jgi:hypothetical protein
MALETPEEFGAAFDSRFQRSAFRLETLSQYVVPNEAVPFGRFLAGRPQDPAWREPWAQFVREAQRDGKQISRVHVVGEPLSDYLQFELTCAYPANVIAGEDVRIMQVPGWFSPPVVTRDFWLFDDREAVVMIYSDMGIFKGAEATSDPVKVARYRQTRDRAMQGSVPLADYLASLGMKEAV